MVYNFLALSPVSLIIFNAPSRGGKLHSKNKWIMLMYDVGCPGESVAQTIQFSHGSSQHTGVIQLINHSTPLHIIMSSMRASLAYLHVLLVPSRKLSWDN